MDKSILSALQLYSFGLTPIPLYEKRPLLKRWSTRFLESPLTEEQIRKGIPDENKIVSYKNKNIGILTGQISNVIVVDIDEMKVLPKLKKYGEIPKTWTVKTSRGIHYYFRYQKDIPSTILWDKIDILSDKKIVVSPPSVHPSGVQYQWLVSPKDSELAELPTWLIGLLTRTNSKNFSQQLYKKPVENERVKSSIEAIDLTEYDWLEFYGRHVSNIRGNSDWLSAKCPFHPDQKNSFTFNKNNGGWACFAGCGKGNGIQFLRKIYGLSLLEVIDLLEGRDLYV